jgi:N-methylhydantoinase A/oxoprolinase/acetone carboxylase beta subunit
VEVLAAVAVATVAGMTRPAVSATAVPAADGRPGERGGRRPVVFDDPARPVDTVVWQVERPSPGQVFGGPCLVELPGCTLVVPPGAEAAADEAGNLRVRLVAAAERVARLASVDDGREDADGAADGAPDAADAEGAGR